MNETTKEKIVYAITLLATLFAIQPIIADIKPVGFDLLSLHITVAHLFYMVGALLGMSVYFYSINYVTDRFFSFCLKIGNFLFALAVLAPPLFIAMWISVTAATFAGIYLNIPMIQEVGSPVFVSLLGATTSIISAYISHRLSRRDRASRIQSITNDEADHVQRARQMLDVGHYDLSILESFRAVEAALRRQLFRRQVSMPIRGNRDLVDISLLHGVIPSAAAQELDNLRRMRNDAVHSTRPMSDENATTAFNIARSILSLLDTDEEEAQQ